MAVGTGIERDIRIPNGSYPEVGRQNYEKSTQDFGLSTLGNFCFLRMSKSMQLFWMRGIYHLSEGLLYVMVYNVIWESRFVHK